VSRFGLRGEARTLALALQTTTSHHPPPTTTRRLEPAVTEALQRRSDVTKAQYPNAVGHSRALLAAAPAPTLKTREIVMVEDQGDDADDDMAITPASYESSVEVPDITVRTTQRGVVAAAVVEDTARQDVLLGADGRPLSGCVPLEVQVLAVAGDLEALDHLNAEVAEQTADGEGVGGGATWERAA